MPGTGSGADGVRSGRRARPIGLSAGSLGLVAAWLGGAAITRLTGAAPVVLVMAAGFVLAVAAAVAGLLTVLRVSVGPVDLPPTSTAGAPVRVRIPVQTSRPVHLVCRMGGATIGAGWVTDGLWDGALTFERRGRVDELQVAVRSAGPVGLLWWERRAVVPIDRADGHLVAPPAGHGTATVETAEVAAAGDAPGVPGASVGDVDGVRPWREGDAEHAVHWPSTLRSRSLVVRDRLHDTGGRWIVRARPAPDDPDREAGLVRRTLEDGLRLGVDLHVAVGDGPSTPVADRSAALAWTATADLGRGRLPEPAVVRWWQRQVVLGARRIEPETTASVSTRWWAAAATMVSLAMLVGALGYSPGVLAAALIGVAGGSLVSSRSLVSGDPPSGVVRAVTGVGALGALVLVAASSGRLDDMLSFLRGPLPQVLIVLIVLHGFECRDRRTIRVSLAISAVVVMYAAGFRVDDRVGWWIVVWSLAASVTLAKMSGPTAWSASTAWPRWGARIATAAGGVVATVGVLVVVPVPDGPAALTLPTFVEDGLAPVGRPGALAGPSGDLRDATAPVTSQPSRAPAGQAGGYTGFASTMDTSVRGDLGDDVVMRVRATAPDYWRGQTFARFDGRTWFADTDPGDLREGPQIEVPAGRGDIRFADDVVVEEFVQTFFLETDMPNVVFHAYRPTRVVVDADVWTRADGALRASTVLPEGSIYTVVSARPLVDAGLLRRQGDLGARLNRLGQEILAPYLEVPPSTTADTVALADRLAAGHSSTYDVVQAYTAWLGDHVEYDLDAPVPEPGEDAVHDFLFDTRRGFCEQIASALTIMLRTQGVPARLATGYLPGTRDRVAGVYEVRAGDAHAWVEVWFPETGWQAFDPTAAVPLSADARIDSLGADLVTGAARYAERHIVRIVSAIVVVAVAVAAWWLGAVLRRRRARGRWGLLQDRFGRLAARRGASTGVTNPRRAAAWADAPQAEAARELASMLDRAAFDPGFDDDDRSYRRASDLVGVLAERGR